MKNFISILSVVAVSACSSLLMIACDDRDNNPTPQSNAPVITDVGTPSGEISSSSIGTTGGSLASIDGKLSLVIPPGALESNTSISIERISNESPLGLGSGYRLLPEGINFSKAVTLKFHYADELPDGTPPDFLWIVTQADNGSWNAMLKSIVDTETQTVTIETTHFSDWALGKFIDLTLEPVSSTVEKGQSVQLRVAGFSRDKAIQDDDDLAPLIPITGDAEVLTPLTSIPPIESRLMDFRIKGWTLNGTDAPVSNSNGSLSASKNNATYTAPNKKPSINPVAVTVELESNNKEGKKASYMLTSTISVIEHDLYLLLKVDGQTYEYYQYGLNGTIPPDPNNFAIVNCGYTENAIAISSSMVTNGMDLSNLFGMELSNPSEGTHELNCFYTDGDDDIRFIPIAGTAYEDERVIRMKLNDSCETEYTCSDFSVTLIIFEDKSMGEVIGFFSGTLYEDKPGYSKDCQNPDVHTIEGEFRLQLIK